MYVAAQEGHSDTVKVLASLHADVNQANNGGGTPMYRAAAYGHSDMVKVLASLVAVV